MPGLPPNSQHALSTGDTMDGIAWDLLCDLPVGVVVYAADGAIQFSNPAAATLLGVEQDTLIDRTSQNNWDVIHEDGSVFPAESYPVMLAIRQRRPVRNVVMGVHRPARDDRIWLLVDAIPQLDLHGTLQRVLVCFDDISVQHQTEEDLRVERDLLTGVMNSSVAAIAVLNPAGQILFANASAEQILGLTPSELTQRSYDSPEWHHTALDGSLWPDEAQPFNRILATGKPVYDIRHAIEWPDGQRRYLSINGEPVKDRQGGIIFLVFLVTDITEHYLAEQALAESESRFRLLAENMSDLVCLHDHQGHPHYISPSATSLLGYTPEELLDKNPLSLIHPDDRERVYNDGFADCLAGAATACTYRIRASNGEYLWLETLFRPIHDEPGKISQIQTTSRDVSEKVQIQQRLEYDALHDGLTGLPNRTLLMERLQFFLERARHHPDYRFAVLFMDLDGFKVVNDSLGHLAGDRLLNHVTSILTANLRSVDLAARLGGDEFVLLLDEIEGMGEVNRVIERLLKAFSKPLDLEGRQVAASASIGVVIGPGNYQRAEDILRDADSAMYRAKHQGRGYYQVFDPAMHAVAMARLHLENDLREALSAKQFVLHYQPIVNLASGKPIGLEVLVRWHHPERGLISPDEFIPVAEEIGLIHPLGEWILREAVRQLCAWRRELPLARELILHVNLSALQLRETDLPRRIEQILQAFELPGDRLGLEITESMLIENLSSSILRLQEIKNQHIHISIDDFGTGYSSLTYLHRLPMDALKIDQSFVRQLLVDPDDTRIIETIVNLARQLSLTAIAEGIEHQQQRQRLQQMGCQQGQGYLFARPLPSAQLRQWLEGFSHP